MSDEPVTIKFSKLGTTKMYKMLESISKFIFIRHSMFTRNVGQVFEIGVL